MNAHLRLKAEAWIPITQAEIGNYLLLRYLNEIAFIRPT